MTDYANEPASQDIEPDLKDYITLASYAETRIEAKKSIFIARAVPVTSESEVEAALDACRKDYPDARHHVYGWRIGSDGRSYLQRYTDDGEPKGTAGLPVLDVLIKGEITDALLIVTRYFGGVLLGTGGLVRAYGKSASGAVAQAGLVRMSQRISYLVRVPYSVYDAFTHWCAQSDVTIEDTVFEADVSLTVALAPTQIEIFTSAIADFTGGLCVPERLGKQYVAMPIDSRPPD